MFKKLLGLLVVATVSTTAYANMTGSEVLAALAGFMSTVVQEDHLTEIQTCAQDSDVLVDDVENMITNIESLSFTGFLKSIEILGRIYGETPYVLRDCENLQDDLKVLSDQAQIFTNIGELTQRITKNYVWHYTEIMNALNTANTDAAKGDYYGYGQNLADAAFIALQP
jgi:hypothetical protein